MEQKQLTAEICGAYFGCEVIESNYGESFEMVSINNDFIIGSRECGMWPYDDIVDEREIKLSDTKLVLRRLESLTNEEAKYSLELLFPRSNYHDRDGMILNLKSLLYKDTFGYVPCKVRETLDYLRSIKIDIGYGGIPSLIDAGLAIEKKY